MRHLRDGQTAWHTGWILIHQPEAWWRTLRSNVTGRNSIPDPADRVGKFRDSPRCRVLWAGTSLQTVICIGVLCCKSEYDNISLISRDIGYARQHSFGNGNDISVPDKISAPRSRLSAPLVFCNCNEYKISFHSKRNREGKTLLVRRRNARKIEGELKHDREERWGAVVKGDLWYLRARSMRL